MKKVLPQTPFLKLSALNLAPTERASQNVKISNNTESALSGLNSVIKSLEKGVWGDSPQCGEMSRSDRGDRLRQRKNLSSERFSPHNYA